MNIKICLFVLFSFLFINKISANENLSLLTFNDDKKIEAVFKKENITGTIVIYNSQKNYLTGYNHKRANTQYSPASTFKIANSLIGLSTGVVKNTDEVFFKYQGQDVFSESWKHDSSLKDAIKVSNVLAYQELARKVGKEKMLINLKKINYGNETIGSHIDTFWLDNSLKISAMQQVEFLYQLANKQLQYPQKIQQDVSEMILLDRSETWKLYGKTGWFSAENNLNTIGWFVGWVEKDKEIYAFAMNMDIKKTNKKDLEKELLKRQKISIESLKVLGIIE
ncbi:class D beta-lactamase [Stenoxybacter acetivorans]|uniref:class D beta-lactamase n=1 Tax=Stenoxybacter acetivorans TaxID=422441 RepID=UPI00055FDFA2|nr:class D beta-lactamase [Stenoxybacter acetivorans]